MRIRTLTLNNFRNIPDITLFPCGGSNIIYGKNAQGKTNILESIWLFSGSKSFRGAKDKDFVRFGTDITSLKLSFFAKGMDQDASIFIGKSNGEKRVLLNDVKLTGTGKLAGEFCAVLFSPDHLLLVKQGPEHRRNMIDISLCQAFPKYAKIIDSYRKILRQRSGLLSNFIVNPQSLDMLDLWDKSLCEYGAYITAVRTGYVKKLSGLSAEIYDGISSGKEKLSVRYAASYMDNADVSDMSRRDIQSRMEKAVRERRNDDILYRKNSVGPHLDDLEICINGVPARQFGSQGQQRSCVLALKLAECGILEERNGEPPVVLLDDVMSELDNDRRNYLLNKLDGKQVFITCCDNSLFSPLEGGRVFEIDNGAIITDDSGGQI